MLRQSRCLAARQRGAGRARRQASRSANRQGCEAGCVHHGNCGIGPVRAVGHPPPRHAFIRTRGITVWRVWYAICQHASDSIVQSRRGAKMSQLPSGRGTGQKKGPGNPGPVWEETERRRASAPAKNRGSETEAWQVAVAGRDAGAGHQQPVDLRHQAAEQRGGRREAERSSVGHGRSLRLGAGAPWSSGG